MQMNSKFLVHKPDWEETQKRFTAWWNRSCIGRPLLSLSAPRVKRLAPEIPVPAWNETDPERCYFDADLSVKRLRNSANGTRYLAESYPAHSNYVGPGTTALYLGSAPVFTYETVWFKEAVEEWSTHPDLRYDPENKWWKKHLELTRRLIELSDGEFLVCIPDLIESVDILSALRGPQALCYDLIDHPDEVKRRLRQMDELYFQFYDRIYDLIKTPEGGSAYCAFAIWGPGKTAKVQCDFSALMSPSQFREFMIPSLEDQCGKLDYSLYHLDGPDAIKHLDALMEVKDLDALQWTAGAGKPDAAQECWDFIHDKVRAAGKSLWMSFGRPDYDTLVSACDRIVKRHGPDGLYLLVGCDGMTEEQGLRFIEHAEKHWTAKG